MSPEANIRPVFHYSFTNFYVKRIEYIAALVETVQQLPLFRSPKSLVNSESYDCTCTLKKLRRKRCCSTKCIAYRTYQVFFTPTHLKKVILIRFQFTYQNCRIHDFLFL